MQSLLPHRKTLDLFASPEQPLETTLPSVTLSSLPRTNILSKTNNIPWRKTWYSDGDSCQSSLANAAMQGKMQCHG